MPKVSIIIPAYNRSWSLPRAVNSIISQSCRDWELWIVDDGSTDDTEQIIREMIDDASNEKNRPSESLSGDINYIRQPHLGVSSARNNGIRRCNGEYICFLDSDDEWFPDKLERQLAWFSANPGGRICQTEELWIRNGVRVNPHKKHKKPEGWIFIPSLALCLVSASAVMIRREVFDRVGLFDVAMPVAEDYDLWLRIALKYPVYLLRKPGIKKYGGHPNQLSHSEHILDYWRIHAMHNIESILREENQDIYLKMLVDELAKKQKIFISGKNKRGSDIYKFG